MANKLFVGGISWSTSDDALKAFFSQVGTVVSATVIMDRFSGKSKGFGFVEMDSDESANKAISLFDGKELDGRTVKVNEAKPMEDRPPRRDNFSRGPRNDFGGNRGGNRY